jgi:predicted ATP-grasp superfamily ATP-dependent carboligase
MRVFIYEFSCAADPKEYPLARRLRSEGSAMLAAVVHDFAGLPGVEILCLLAEGSEDSTQGYYPPPLQGSKIRTRIHEGNEMRAFESAARNADFALIIAPESQNILLDRCRWVEDAGSKLLGPPSAAVEMATDKWLLAERLARGQVPVPYTRLLNGEVPHDHWRFPAVLKPRQGAGSQDCYLVGDVAQLHRHLERIRAGSLDGDMLVQTYAPGQPASVAFLVGTQDNLALLPATQDIVNDNGLHYIGGTIPLPNELARRAIALGRRAIALIPQLLSYVSVDLVLGGSLDGSEDYVIEINPRLTTSYIGLRALTNDNLAERMLDAFEGKSLRDATWRPGGIRFSAAGQVTQI